MAESEVTISTTTGDNKVPNPVLRPPPLPDPSLPTRPPPSSLSFPLDEHILNHFQFSLNETLQSQTTPLILDLGTAVNASPKQPESHNFTGRNGSLKTAEFVFTRSLAASPPLEPPDANPTLAPLPKPPDLSLERADSTMPPPPPAPPDHTFTPWDYLLHKSQSNPQEKKRQLFSNCETPDLSITLQAALPHVFVLEQLITDQHAPVSAFKLLSAIFHKWPHLTLLPFDLLSFPNVASHSFTTNTKPVTESTIHVHHSSPTTALHVSPYVSPTPTKIEHTPSDFQDIGTVVNVAQSALVFYVCPTCVLVIPTSDTYFFDEMQFKMRPMSTNCVFPIIGPHFSHSHDFSGPSNSPLKTMDLLPCSCKSKGQIVMLDFGLSAGHSPMHSILEKYGDTFPFINIDLVALDPGKIILWANFYNLEDKVGLHGLGNVKNNTIQYLPLGPNQRGPTIWKTMFNHTRALEQANASQLAALSVI